MIFVDFFLQSLYYYSMKEKLKRAPKKEQKIKESLVSKKPKRSHNLAYRLEYRRTEK